MRNIIFTSLIGLLPVMAIADGPATGCYERSYSREHLAANPAQVVAKMRMLVYVDDRYNETLAQLEVQTTNQGHVAGTAAANQTFRQALTCFEDGLCAVECDGGSFQIVRQDKDGLSFRTRYLRVGQGQACAGATDLAEVAGQDVSYRLNAAPMSVCDRLRDN